MASVYKKSRDKRRPGASWFITFVDEKGRRRTLKGCPDKAATEAMARKLESEAELRRRGVIDPKADAYVGHEARPLSAHLDDFRAMLVAKNGTAKHATMTTTRARRVIDLSRAGRISELSPTRILEALATLRAGGLGAETINHHVRAVKGFARWLWREGRSREHTLAHLATANPEADRRRRRRALTPDEAARLVRAAERGRTVMRMTGPDRARLYALALGTGLRVSELASLTPARLDLTSGFPVATVPAAYTKNGREAVQPIPPVLAARLAPWLATLPPDRPVFAVPTRPAEMIRVDLEAAGIPFETSAGRADFHSLRGVYISNLVASGASVKTCQVLARHSTPSLTIGVYAKASLHDIAGAVAALPDLPTGAPTREPMAATGTDPAPIRAAHGKRAAGGQGRSLAVTGGMDGGDERPRDGPAPGRNSGPETGLDGQGRPQAAPGGITDGGTRTHMEVPLRRILSPRVGCSKVNAGNGLREGGLGSAAHGKRAARETHAELAEIVDAWPSLDEATRAAILALVRREPEADGVIPTSEGRSTGEDA